MKKIKKIILIILIIICLFVMVESLYKIINWKQSNDENQATKEELKKYIIEEEPKETEVKKYNIDFDKLQEQNSDTVAYLKVNNTKIDYVVVKGKNNSYYLNHNFDKKVNVAGWVFSDYHNKFDGTDKNIVIFGHNMKNGSMFGTLKYILKSEWFNNKDNHIILLADEHGEHYYQVFSTYIINVEDYYINTIFENDDEFYKFINVLKNRSKYNYNVELEKTDKILTLSTCSSAGKKRVVLHAKLLKED